MTEQHKFISKTEIKQWLYSKQQAEINFENFYHQMGRLLKMEEIYENVSVLSAPIKNTGIYIHTDLKCIYPGYQNLRETIDFNEDDWFHPFLDISIHKHPKFYPEFFHQHDFFEICYVLDGECKQTMICSGKLEYCKLSKGDLIIFPPHLEHSVCMDSDSVAVNMLMRSSTFKQVFLHNIPSDNMLYEYFSKALYVEYAQNYLIFKTEGDEELFESFYDMAYEYCNNLSLSGRIMDLQLSIFFAKLLREHYQTFQIGGAEMSSIEKIPSILQYIEINYASTDISDIARYFHFNPSYLSKLFRKNTGRTIISELQNVRISKAKELLETTSIPVENLAYMVGYEDQTHFIRLFKKINGCTPAQYRKKFINSQNKE